jgi:hypothetical protein
MRSVLCHESRGGIKLDPFTGGIVLVSAFGGTLLGIGLLERAGVKINSGFLTVAMEIVKFGGILYILKVVSTLFL